MEGTLDFHMRSESIRAQYTALARLKFRTLAMKLELHAFETIHPTLTSGIWDEEEFQREYGMAERFYRRSEATTMPERELIAEVMLRGTLDPAYESLR